MRNMQKNGRQYAQYAKEWQTVCVVCKRMVDSMRNIKIDVLENSRPFISQQYITTEVEIT